MRKTIIVVGVLALAAPSIAGAQQDDGHRIRAVSRVVVNQQPRPRVYVGGRDRDAREEQTESFKKTIKLGSNGELDVSNIAGNIELKRGAGSEATIEATKVARARTVDEAKELLPLVKIEVGERGTRAEVRTVYPDERYVYNNRRNVNVQVHYTITVPAGTRVSVRSISGDIRSADITGELSLVTTSGNVQVIKAKRVSAAKTTSGSVSIADTDSDLPIEAGSVSGDIMVNRVKASRMELSTISGKVVLQDVTSDRVEAQSLSGDVEFGGPLLKGGRYELTSHSGNVRVTVAGGSGFEVEANSWSGNVQSDLPMTGGVQQASGRGPRRKELKGVVGDGSAMLEITTFSGNVLITKR